MKKFGLEKSVFVDRRKESMGEVITCLGFQAAGIAAGIKKPGILDLGLIYSEIPANVAGVFTRNLVKAAPVLLSKQRLAAGV